MREALLACKILGDLCMCTGAYVIGNWNTVIGVLFMLAGYNLLNIKKDEVKLEQDKGSQTWVGD